MKSMWLGLCFWSLWQFVSCRRLVELEEQLDAMDAAIEFRNESITSRQNELRRSVVHLSAALGKSHHGLAKLQSLSVSEMRSLLGRYFDRVVDLRDFQRRLQLQRAELEVNCLTEV